MWVSKRCTRAAVAFDHGYVAVYDLKGRGDLFSPDGMLL
jgi:hypothetical protein